jgi:hypothetical protein
MSLRPLLHCFLTATFALLFVLAEPLAAQTAESTATAATEPAPAPKPVKETDISALEKPEDAPAKKWALDLTLYAFAAGLDGEIGARRTDADVDVDFFDILENLEFAAMGKVRVGYDRWALTTDVLYLGLGASNNIAVADLDQWMVEPTVSYRVNPYFEPLAGVRYNSLSTTVIGTLGRQASGNREWVDPIIGTNLTLPLSEKVALHLRGDIGGFGVGSDLTWQLYPRVSWRFHRHFSVDAGYRLLYMDYLDGGQANRFDLEVLIHGPQVGFTAHF